MRRISLGGLALVAASSSFGQSMEELQRQLVAKESEIRQLRQRIEVLEREATPRRIAQQRIAPAMPEDEQADSNRALERALVRERGLLLSPATFEVEPNFIYSHSDYGSGGFRRDSYGPGLTLRAGLPRHSQIEMTLPYVVERLRNDSTSSRSHGRGDLVLGLSHQLLIERGRLPSVIGALSYQAATGANTVFESPTPVARGSGFDSLQASLTAVKRLDPLVFFGSYSYTHFFSETKSGTKVEPGKAHGLRFGTALATAPASSLRAAVNLTFFDKTKFGGTPLPGTDDPTAFLELGGSAVLTESTAVDVLFGAGLTRSTPDFRITVSLPIRY